jgi:SAM-dependent MidA family methyltransferase
MAMRGLPVPDEAALAHSAALVARLREAISRRGGCIPFRDFMSRVLYEPGLGYYSAGAAKFGPAGDFITAPEISPLFSYCIARQCGQVLAMHPGGVILELGAGSGNMACHILRALRDADCVPSRYWILEPSADLRDRQRRLISESVPDFMDRVTWLDALPDEPFVGMILANEVLDALPVTRVVLRSGKIYELGVAWHGDGFAWRRCEATEQLQARALDVLAVDKGLLPDGYRTEINTDLPGWLAAVTARLEAGAMLAVDYGYSRREYYHPQRVDGTLICHYRHRAHSDPFFHPGLQDISASVEFSAVAEAGRACGLELAGFNTQAHFLMGCGINDLIATECRTNPVRLTQLSREAKYLMLPGELGERFKVIALSRNVSRPLLGFSVVDHRSRL